MGQFFEPVEIRIAQEVGNLLRLNPTKSRKFRHCHGHIFHHSFPGHPHGRYVRRTWSLELKKGGAQGSMPTPCPTRRIGLFLRAYLLNTLWGGIWGGTLKFPMIVGSQMTSFCTNLAGQCWTCNSNPRNALRAVWGHRISAGIWSCLKFVAQKWLLCFFFPLFFLVATFARWFDKEKGFGKILCGDSRISTTF